MAVEFGWNRNFEILSRWPRECRGIARCGYFFLDVEGIFIAFCREIRGKGLKNIWIYKIFCGKLMKNYTERVEKYLDFLNILWEVDEKLWKVEGYLDLRDFRGS